MRVTAAVGVGVWATCVIGQKENAWVSAPMAAYNPVPLPVKGQCVEGTQYIVTAQEQLYDLVPEIECVWNQGFIPSKVPLGPCFGRALPIINTTVLDFLTEFVYQGDYLVETKCHGKRMYVGILHFAGIEASAGIWELADLGKDKTFIDGDWYDGRGGILMDFSADPQEYCTAEGDVAESGKIMKNFFRFRSHPWPFRVFIDMLRLVGRDEKGCGILLGRTWMRDYSQENGPLYTVLFFTLKNCDQSMSPEITSGLPLPPIERTYPYSRHGATEFLKRINPLQYFNYRYKMPNGAPMGIHNYHTYYGLTEEEKRLTPTVPPYAQPKEGRPVRVVHSPFEAKTFDIPFINKEVQTAWQHLGTAVKNYWTTDTQDGAVSPNPFAYQSMVPDTQ